MNNNCGQCGASTVQTCNDNGCTFLENGNGEPEECCKISQEDLFGVGGKPSCPKCFHATGNTEALKESRPAPVRDIDLERRALKACGYRVHEKERNGTRWLMAVKGLQVQYKHWHPLTSIHQAMQLLIDAPEALGVQLHHYGVAAIDASDTRVLKWVQAKTAQDLINAQCRAIVTACASLEAVR